ncbi:MAG: LuxR family two component transcriptional regulator [Verrucomicrobiales bacterium]|nr:LuxR family two component transcriptional regulator [Verrucomicrobiales bacterium]
MKKNATLQIVLVDDHPILRQAMKQFIDSEPDFQVIGESGNAIGAIDLARQLKPQAMVLDISLAGSNGIDAAREIKRVSSGTKILMFSMHDENVYAPRALEAGASGYIMKQEAPEKVIVALRKILAGGVYLSEALESRMLKGLKGGASAGSLSPLEVLSNREFEVFGLIGKGRATREIADTMKLSVKTVESHRAHIKEKMNLENGNQLVHVAIQWQLEQLCR